MPASDLNMMHLDIEACRHMTIGASTHHYRTEVHHECITGTETAGQSLQLKGTGSQYSEFTWTADSADSFGAINAGQTFRFVASCFACSWRLMSVVDTEEIDTCRCT